MVLVDIHCEEESRYLFLVLFVLMVLADDLKILTFLHESTDTACFKNNDMTIVFYDPFCRYGDFLDDGVINDVGFSPFF